MKVVPGLIMASLLAGTCAAGQEFQAMAIKPGAAKLVYLANEVLLRRAGSADWLRAVELADLFRNDTLYTRAGARAEVKFHAGERLSLAPNTLAVLNPPGRKDADVEMLAGELRSFKSRVLTRSAVITPKGADAEFTARVAKDLSTVVKVSRGSVDVEAQGKKVEVKSGYGLVVKSGMAPPVPVKLAAPPPPGAAPAAPAALPAPAAPDEKMVFTEPISGYRVQVSRDAGFSAPVLDKVYSEIERPDLRALLPPGEYYLRVAPIDLLGYEGKFKSPSRLSVK